MGANVVTRGDREISLRFDTFPERARKKLEERITAITDKLAARIRAATPRGRTGRLQSEITPKVYTGENRVAGYVSVYAPGNPQEYPKAAALEYGWWARRDPETGIVSRLMGNNRRAKARMAGAHHIGARMYLRGPLAQMQPEIETDLEEAIAEVTAEENPT